MEQSVKFACTFACFANCNELNFSLDKGKIPRPLFKWIFEDSFFFSRETDFGPVFFYFKEIICLLYGFFIGSQKNLIFRKFEHGKQKRQTKI